MSTVDIREYYAIQYRLDSDTRWRLHHGRGCKAPNLYVHKGTAESIAKLKYSGLRHSWRVVRVEICCDV